MAEGTDAKHGAGVVRPARRPLVETARGVVAQMAARVPGISGEAAVRNAWEAACSDLERRREWDVVYDATGMNELDGDHPKRPTNSSASRLA
jgi:hypothetical protein